MGKKSVCLEKVVSSFFNFLPCLEELAALKGKKKTENLPFAFQTCDSGWENNSTAGWAETGLSVGFGGPGAVVVVAIAKAGIVGVVADSRTGGSGFGAGSGLVGDGGPREFAGSWGSVPAAGGVGGTKFNAAEGRKHVVGIHGVSKEGRLYVDRGAETRRWVHTGTSLAGVAVGLKSSSVKVSGGQKRTTLSHSKTLVPGRDVDHPVGTHAPGAVLQLKLSIADRIGRDG